MTRKHKVGIGLLAAVAAFTVAGFLVFGALKRMVYPLAPAMPPVVSKSVDDLLTELDAVLRAKAPLVLEQLQPGLSSDEISVLERQAGIKLPEDIRALYRWRNGCRREEVDAGRPVVEGPMPDHRFVPLDEALSLRLGAAPRSREVTAVQRIASTVLAGHRNSWIGLFDDDCGDGYFFDPVRKPTEGSLFFCFAEDGLYVFFPSARNLLAGIVKCYERGAFKWQDDGEYGPGLYNDFERSAEIWREFGAGTLDGVWP